MKDLLLIGAGGLGREVAAMVTTFMADDYRLIGFVDDGVPSGSRINGIEVLGNIEWLNNYKTSVSVAIAIGSPTIKANVHQSIKKEDIDYPNLIHPNSRIHNTKEVKMGMGNIITDGCILTTNITLGDFNLINLACTIGHDTEIGNYCSIMPGVNISGGGRLKNQVYIGTGAKLIKGTIIYENSTVGAGAVVTTDVPMGKTFIGIPAKEIEYGG